MQKQFKSWKSGSDPGAVHFRFLVIVMNHFDTVAEQVGKIINWRIHLVRRLVTSETDTSEMTISSSSGEQRRFKWNLYPKEGAEVNMCAHDHRLNPRVPQPTSFDGIEPSFIEWSKEVIAFLPVTDYQVFITLLTAAASSKDIIQADVMFTGVLSDTLEEIKRKSDEQVKKEPDLAKAQAENRPQEVQDLTKEIQNVVTEITTLKENLSRGSQLCSKRTSFCDARCFMRLQAIQTSWPEESRER